MPTYTFQALCLVPHDAGEQLSIPQPREMHQPLEVLLENGVATIMSEVMHDYHVRWIDEHRVQVLGEHGTCERKNIPVLRDVYVRIAPQSRLLFCFASRQQYSRMMNALWPRSQRPAYSALTLDLNKLIKKTDFCRHIDHQLAKVCIQDLPVEHLPRTTLSATAVAIDALKDLIRDTPASIRSISFATKHNSSSKIYLNNSGVIQVHSNEETWHDALTVTQQLLDEVGLWRTNQHVW